MKLCALVVVTRKAVATAMKRPLIQSFLTGTVKSQINPTYICRELWSFQTYFLEKAKFMENVLALLHFFYLGTFNENLVFQE